MNSPASGVDAGITSVTLDANTSPDAHTGPDANLSDENSPSGIVTVTVYDFYYGAPAANLPVAFLDQYGNTELLATTNAQGVALAKVHADSSVTVGAGSLMRDASGDITEHVLTWLDVQPGDNLVAGRPMATTSYFSVDVTTPIDATADWYNVSTSCGSSSAYSNLVSVEMSPGCSSTDVFISSGNGSNLTPSSLYVPGTAVTPGASLTFDQPLIPFSVFNWTLLNSAPDTAGVSFGINLMDGASDLFGSGAYQPSNGDISNGDSFNWAATTPLDVVTGACTTDTADCTHGKLDREANTNSKTFDMSVDATPEMDALPIFDSASSKLVWTENGSGAVNSSFGFISVTGANNRGFYHWIVGPHTAGSLAVPVLPEPMAMFNVASSDLVSVYQTTIANYSIGFDAERASFFATPNVWESQFMMNGVSSLGDHVEYSSRGQLQ